MNDFFTTIYEDNDILVINKPAGLVVESENKNDLTLEKILEKDYKLSLPRSGIVHRLDRDTSGVMVIAKNEKSLINLQNQFASHQVEKIYYTLVYGKLEPEKGTINIALKRDPKNRTRFIASRNKDAREAVTHYSVVNYLKSQISNPNDQTNPKLQITKNNNGDLSLLEINLETGRTHQIRAHFFAIGYPIIGDSIYKSPLSQEFSRQIGLNRQFLHAGELSFTHPTKGEKMEFKAELPDDLGRILG
uniref:Pseudouridine synthase RsuA/RluA-like domain-containing protein n=1 Tax=candidate division CPR3 bacterium TaxID=2268181 RepID=A0A7C4R4N0_UNCC3